MDIRLQAGGAYLADIGALCSQIRANGSVPHLQWLTLKHPSTNGVTVDVALNLAFQSHGAAITGSLYFLAFRNAHGSWHFDLALPGLALPGQNLPGIDGSYRSLGFPLGLPAITYGKLADDVKLLAAFNGANQDAAKEALARVAIVVSEASRFTDVSIGINKILGKATTYQPDSNQIHNWGGHTLSA